MHGCQLQNASDYADTPEERFLAWPGLAGLKGGPGRPRMNDKSGQERNVVKALSSHRAPFSGVPRPQAGRRGLLRRLPARRPPYSQALLRAPVKAAGTMRRCDASGPHGRRRVYRN